MSIYKKITITLLILLIALISITKVSPYTANEELYSHTIEQIDTEIESVLKLAAGATGASAGISLLPDDQCTPIAQEFAELAKYFLVVLSALYLEKYLVSMMGFVSFAVILPLACALLWGGIMFGREKVRSLSYKLFITAIAVFLVIPVSVRTSETIYNKYESTIEQTIEEADEISIVNEDATGVEKFIAWVENAAGTIVDYVTGLLSRLIEAVAVMLVTSCLIPVLVIVFFMWLIKVFFKVDFTMTDAEKLLKKEKT